MSDHIDDAVSAETKLYVKESADKARNHAIGVLTFVALLMGLLAALNLEAMIKIKIDEKFQEEGTKILLEELENNIDQAKSGRDKIALLQMESQNIVNGSIKTIDDQLNTLRAEYKNVTRELNGAITEVKKLKISEGVGVQQGIEQVLASHFSDYIDKLTEEGERFSKSCKKDENEIYDQNLYARQFELSEVKEYRVSFKRSFETVPIVFLSVTQIDFRKTSYPLINVSAHKPSKDGFILQVSKNKDCALEIATIQWLALVPD